jgi:hypothetical protein
LLPLELLKSRRSQKVTVLDLRKSAEASG